MKDVTFQEAIEVVESLPAEQRESLIELVKRRLNEERRERLVQDIRQAREEFARGDFRKGTVEDLFQELQE